MKLSVHSLIATYNGELTSIAQQGEPIILLRLQGCNLSCIWCDTIESLKYRNDKDVSVEHIIKNLFNIKCELGIEKLLITGGEPLLQRGALHYLLPYLLKDFRVTVETNGSVPIVDLVGYAAFVVDYKLPGSGETRSMLPIEERDPWRLLTAYDFIKFVVSQHHLIEDLERTCTIYNKVREKNKEVKICIGCTSFEPFKQIEEFVRLNKMNDVYLNVQIHKLIGVA